METQQLSKKLGMMQFIKTTSQSFAYRKAPWAAILTKTETGYVAFLTADDYLVWKEKGKTFYK